MTRTQTFRANVGIVVLNGKWEVLALERIDKEALKKGVHAGEVVKAVSPVIGGGGGGRPNFAQGGGTQPEKLREAVEKAEETIKKQLRH